MFVTVGRAVPGGNVYHWYAAEDEWPPVNLCKGGDVATVLERFDEDARDERDVLTDLGLKSSELCGRCFPRNFPYWRKFREQLEAS